MQRDNPPFRALTIAGSDSGGGAGVQADLKTLQALGCYGMSVITVVTAQNTIEVKGVHPLPPAFVADQINAVMGDIGVDAIKVGMLYSQAIIESVASCLSAFKGDTVIVDPVRVAKGGSRLLEAEAIGALKKLILPLAGLVTPNIPEAEILTGLKIETAEQMESAAHHLLKVCHRVVIKGGHLANPTCRDLFATVEGERVWTEHPRINTRNTHGTGCTFSAAITAFVAQGFDWKISVEKASAYLHEAIVQGANSSLGSGFGPVDHSWNIRR